MRKALPLLQNQSVRLPSVTFTGRCHVSGGEVPPNPHDYRDEARRIRELAAETKDAQVRLQLLVIASLYEKLAEHVRGEGNAS